MKRLFLLICMVTLQAYAEDRRLIPLWPGAVPGESGVKAPPVMVENASGDVVRLTQVTDPLLTVYEAKPENANGAAIIICPGGAYNMLAINKEGYEIADWLSDLGYTAFVLQYRVPKNKAGALQDALRAIRCVRGMREEWNVDSNRIGILGFSAGGSLSARASTRYEEVLYEPFDDWDKQSARPDFAVLIYPAYLDQGPKKSLTPELTLNADCPPMFLFVAADDRFANSSLVFSSALNKAKLPFELHVVPQGGHGFGIRAGNRAAETWPGLCQQWLDVTVLGDK